jgi:hypothetical protein
MTKNKPTIIIAPKNISNDALYILIQSVKYSYHQGIFSIGETEVMSKALRVLTRENEEKKEG